MGPESEELFNLIETILYELPEDHSEVVQALEDCYEYLLDVEMSL